MGKECCNEFPLLEGITPKQHLEYYPSSILGALAGEQNPMVFAFVCTFTTLVFPLLLIFLFLTGYAFISLIICILFLEKACGKGGQKKEASPEIHSGLYPPCRRWNHGCRQFCKLPPDATLDSSEPFQILLRRHTGACLFAGSGCSAVLDVGFDSGSLSGSGSKPCFLRGVTVKSKGDALEQVTARRPPFLLQFPKRSYLKFIW